MADNKLYTLGYFRKRLLDNGISSRILIKDYPENDQRRWSISIGKNHIMCICLKNDDEVKFDFLYYVKSSNPFSKIKILSNYCIKTSSMEIIIKEFINIERISIGDDCAFNS